MKKSRRILVVDDNDEIHNDFRRILCPEVDTSDLDSMGELLFGAARAAQPDARFEVTSARQGPEALEEVRRARAAGAPYMLIFVDVRMPPGWDGVETLSHVWREDPEIQSVICSAYLDYSWRDILARFPETDRLLILKKPFDPIEVRQMAYALTEKWNQLREAKRAEEALRRSEAKNHALLRAIPDDIFLVDRDGVATDVKAQRPSALPPDMASAVLHHLDRALATGAPQMFEHPRATADDPRDLEVRLVGTAPDEALVLVRDITARKRAEAAAEQQRRNSEMIRVQAQALSELSTPLIPIHEDIIVLPLIGEMDAARARKVHEKLIGGIAERRARVAILDITGLPGLHPEVADELVRAARAVRLLGAEVVLTGIHPAVARTLVEMNINLSDIPTQSTLASGIAYATKRRG